MPARILVVGACFVCALSGCDTGPSRHRISGTLAGTAPLGVRMTLGGSAVSTTVTATDGTYSFDQLPDGPYTVTPSRNTCDAFTPATASVELRGRDVVQDFTFVTAQSFFEFTGSMTVSRPRHSATLMQDGKVLVAGGFTEIPGEMVSVPALSSAEVYDPATGRFTRTGDMANPRGGHQAILLEDGRVMILGGRHRYGGELDATSFELFDPATGRFSQGDGACGGVAALLPGGDVYFPGGCTYHPASGLLSAAASLAAALPFTSTEVQYGTATSLPDGTVLVVGTAWGHVDAGFAQVQLLYEPASDRFVSVAPWGCQGGQTPTPTLLRDGTVFIQNCWRDPSSELVTGIFAPRTRSFELVGECPVPNDVGTLLESGDVLLWPLPSRGSWFERILLFSPVSRTFAPVDSPAIALPGAAWTSGTRLADGRVLFTGGPSAMLYTPCSR